jgi:hypothetical protein
MGETSSPGRIPAPFMCDRLAGQEFRSEGYAELATIVKKTAY